MWHTCTWALTNTSNFTTVLHSSCDRCTISWIMICSLQTVDTCLLAYFIVLASNLFEENLTNTQTRDVQTTECSRPIPLQSFTVMLFYIYLRSMLLNSFNLNPINGYWLGDHEVAYMIKGLYFVSALASSSLPETVKFYFIVRLNKYDFFKKKNSKQHIKWETNVEEMHKNRKVILTKQAVCVAAILCRCDSRWNRL